MCNSFRDNKMGASNLIDLKKTFDIINYDILFSKLENICTRRIYLNWIKSYITNRYIRLLTLKTIYLIKLVLTFV